MCGPYFSSIVNLIAIIKVNIMLLLNLFLLLFCFYFSIVLFYFIFLLFTTSNMLLSLYFFPTFMPFFFPILLKAKTPFYIYKPTEKQSNTNFCYSFFSLTFNLTQQPKPKLDHSMDFLLTASIMT